MNLMDQVYAQALILAGSLEPSQEAMLRVLSRGAIGSLKARLRENLTPEDCMADFVASASLYALAALSEARGLEGMESFDVGDVTVRQGSPLAAANCLRYQADMMVRPYLRDNFSFRGV